MSIPTQETLPRLLHRDGVMRWAELLIARLEKNIQDWLLYASTITLNNGDNNNVNLNKGYLVRITGPTGAFAVTGLAGGATGKIAVLYNTTGQGLTIKNQSASSGAANRITTMTGADVTMTGPSTALFVYSLSGWILLASNPVSATTTPTDTVSTGRQFFSTYPLDLSTGTVVVNTNAVSVTGVPTASQDSTGRYHSFTTTTSAGSSRGWLGNPGAQVQRQLLPDITWIVKTGPAASDIVGLTIWASCFGSAGAQDVANAATQFGFRFRTPAGDSTWQSVTTTDGNTPTVQDTLVSVGIATRYNLRARWTDVNTVAFSINGVAKTTHTTNLPGSATNMFVTMQLINDTAGTARTFLIGGYTGSEL